MASRRDIGRRIRSISNTAQITKAMQMVAAARMRKAQQRVQAARPYAENIREIVGDVASRPGAETHPLLQRRDVKTAELVFVTPDRGLAGALPGNLKREAAKLFDSIDAPVRVIAVGRKGRDFTLRTRNQLVAEFTGLGDNTSITEIGPIVQQVLDDYENGEADVVYLIYSRFINTLQQQPTTEQLVPCVPPEHEQSGLWNYEPDNPVLVLSSLLPRYIEFAIYHALLESLASEHSARMVAMRNATDNANDLIQDLTLLMNKARQAEITKEISEISAGAEAIRAEA